MKVGFDVEWMGIRMLCILMDGYYERYDVPHIEELKEKCMDGVGPMELRGGNVEITGMTPREFPLSYLGMGS
jgi:hypothetical protein